MSPYFSILGLILLLDKQAFAYEVCQITSFKTYYCNDGYHCCYDDTQCCSDGLTVGTWAGIIIGIIIFKSILICFCVRACRRHRAQQTVITVRRPIIKTVTGPPPYSAIGNQPYPGASGGYNNTVAYQAPKTPSGPPPPYTAP